jgi:hypothetical protein
MAKSCGLPPAAGPGSSLDGSQWGQLILEARLSSAVSIFEMVQRSSATTANLLRAAQLGIQVARYQVDHGQPPARLDDLVPGYLTELPTRAHNNELFGYFIYRSEDAALAMLGASTVGLSGSPWGQGILPTASALTPGGGDVEAGGMPGAAADAGPGGPGSGPGPGGLELFAPERLILFQQALGLPDLPGDSVSLLPGQRCMGLADVPGVYFPVPVWRKR